MSLSPATRRAHHFLSIQLTSSRLPSRVLTFFYVVSLVALLYPFKLAAMMTVRDIEADFRGLTDDPMVKTVLNVYFGDGSGPASPWATTRINFQKIFRPLDTERRPGRALYKEDFRRNSFFFVRLHGFTFPQMLLTTAH